MRGIKFRAWDIVDNKMMLENNFWLYRNFEFARKSKKLSLMQYTGLKDKNGVEIYEGDICKTNLVPFIRYVSVFEEGCFMFEEHDGGRPIEWVGRISSTELEVIGNIYENKDLLK